MDENDIDETFLPDNGENSDPTPLADDLLHFYKTFIVPDAGMTFILDSLVKHNVSGVPTSLYLLKKKIPGLQVRLLMSILVNSFTLGLKTICEFISTKET